MQTHDLNGSIHTGENKEAPLHQKEEETGPMSGMANCEAADRCCVFWPIKCGMMVCALGHVLNMFIYEHLYVSVVFSKNA